MRNKKRHKRSRVIGLTVVGVTALAVGGGALLMTDNDASAARQPAGRQAPAGTAMTVKCPDAATRLASVPQQARPTVDKELATMDSQVADAYKQLAARGPGADRDWVRTRVLEPLTAQRRGALNRIGNEIGRVASRPSGLDTMAPCTVQEAPNPAAAPASASAGATPAAGTAAPAAPAAGGQAQSGPVRADFVDIRKVKPNVKNPRTRGNASRGTFSSRCGRNENKHFNSDNVIVAPGVSNGAHHMHDYVGNRDTDAFSTNDSLAAAGTTCSGGDRSTHYWPVLRLQDGTKEVDADAPGGGTEGNIGRILRPATASITFRGSAVSKVAAMPKFLRIITGDAKAFTGGTANANASWSCTGFENRQLKDKYPLCPKGSKVVRTFKFQSCWDGKNADSANHRTHVAFADAKGACAKGFRAIPQLVQRITYKVAPGSLFAVDSFPEQLHKPVTDHGDFINVMSGSLMKKAVKCINTGRKCG
ncbi:DUF1996 domain-containing protein [Streptomyces iranensis]|uniref:Coagulation factor 5/8 type domain protein n=1 Tax=Streptomyces iranensis TaxID=576784 RepID=A0A061A9E8_9ACTN|nr:DUF1996 domain-containing protein [Streptomyces iranensis]MBP2059780.1 flagellar basal body-associated protein FliL [Streptomyces iranensis]CDR14959.1 coagulation factor 5/8 type domain protein [Streptomyces iranensis]